MRDRLMFLNGRSVGRMVGWMVQLVSESVSRLAITPVRQPLRQSHVTPVRQPLRQSHFAPVSEAFGAWVGAASRSAGAVGRRVPLLSRSRLIIRAFA